MRDGQKWRFKRVTIDNAWAEGDPEILDFSLFTAGVTINNGKLESTGTEFKNFDKIIGTAKNDTLDFSNSAGKLEIRGGAESDEIKGGAGADKLFGENVTKQSIRVLDTGKLVGPS